MQTAAKTLLQYFIFAQTELLELLMKYYLTISIQSKL